MPLYRKKPVVIEAEQWFPGKDVVGVEIDHVTAVSEAHQRFGVPIGTERFYVVTIHKQRCYLKPGDWIIPEPDGIHYYPVKPDIFESTYEPV